MLSIASDTAGSVLVRNHSQGLSVNGDVAAGRQPAEPDREPDDEQQAQEEVGHRDAEHGDHHRRLVDPAILPQRRQDAGADAETSVITSA